VNQKIATIALAIAALAVVLVFLFLPGPPAPTAPTAQDTKAPAEETARAEKNFSDFGSDIGVSAPKPGAATAGTSLPAGMAWEDRLDELLTTEADNTTTVRGLVSSMRGLPPEAQEEFVAHAVNLCEDEQFDLLANVYFEAATPSEVKETIFNDVLNRPDEIKLPLLAKTLRNPTHPMAGESKEILEMYLDLEPGAVPPNGWDQAVSDYIKQQGE
jgi:hypothetical protein